MASTARYRVRVLAEAHEVAVELQFDGIGPGPLRLQTPTWVPGAYGFMKYGRDLMEVRAVDRASGAPLPLERDGWAGYVVESKGPLTVHFKAYAFDPAWGELVGFVAHDQALLLAAHYLFAPAHAGPCVVEYALPDGWQLHHPSGARQLAASVFEYASFAALLDTPVVAGRFERLTRAIAGVPFHFVFMDRALGFDAKVDSLLDVVSRVAEECHKVFGGFPFEDYSFILTFDPQAKWGLEHASATTIALDADLFVDEKSFASGVRVCAHELFHAWNVCRLKPAPLGKPDLDRGSFPEALWVSEGITRYYEFLLLARAGVLPAPAFFSNVVNYYRQLVSHPAYERVSLLDSSRATFLNHNRYPGSVNASIDYYDKGMLVAFDLDVALRQRTPDSLDRALADFYRSFAGKGEGFTHADAVSHFARFPEARSLLAREVEGKGGLSVLESLAKLGFEVAEEDVKALGIVLSEKTPNEIANVVDDSPAGKCGLGPLDLIQRVNGFPSSPKALEWAAWHEPKVALQVARGNRSLTFEMIPATRKQVGALTWRGSEEQAEAVQRWLGRDDFRPRAGEAIPLDPYENFHGIQKVV